jgi:hypothetical protein
MSILTNDYVQEYMRNRWLNLGDTSKIHTTNPFANRNDYEIENPHIFLLDYMRKPENFGFTCEVLFGKTLAPFQIAILRELWIRQFPAFIGCRGLGKCITGNSLVQTNRGISTIEAIVKTNKVKEPVYYNGSLKICGENGYKDVAYGWNNGLSETVKIKTRMGYELEGTKNHPIRVVKQKEIVWKNLEDVTKDDVVIIDRTPRWHTPEKTLPDDLAYLLGLLAGDGGFTIRGHITLTSADPELVDAANIIAYKYWGKIFKKQKAKYEHLLCSVDIWDKMFNEYGFPSSVCEHKNIPSSILSGIN